MNLKYFLKMRTTIFLKHNLRWGRFRFDNPNIFSAEFNENLHALLFKYSKDKYSTLCNYFVDNGVKKAITDFSHLEAALITRFECNILNIFWAEFNEYLHVLLYLYSLYESSISLALIVYYHAEMQIGGFLI